VQGDQTDEKKAVTPEREGDRGNNPNTVYTWGWAGYKAPGKDRQRAGTGEKKVDRALQFWDA